MTNTSRVPSHTHPGGKAAASHDHDVTAALNEAIATHEARYHPVIVPVPPDPPPATLDDAPLGTLRALLAAASSGGTVDVPARHYHEQQLIAVAKPLTMNFAGDVSSDGKLGTLIRFQGQGIVARNLTALGASTAVGADQQGYVEVSGAPGAQLLAVSIDGGPNAGLRLWDSPNVQVGVREIKNAPVVGVVGWNCPGGKILAGGSVHHNGITRPDGNSGGIKIGGTMAGTPYGFDIGAVECHHNHGRGAWYDVYAKGSGFTGTRTHHNSHNGVMVEIQDGYYVRGVVSYEDAWSLSGELYWAGGILVSSSGNGEVTGCIAAWCPTPIVLAGQAGRTAISDGHATPDGVNGYRNNVHDNLVTANRAGKPVYAWSEAGSGSPMDQQTASSGNAYGVNNLTATAAQLAAAGVPVAPEAHA